MKGKLFFAKNRDRAEGAVVRDIPFGSYKILHRHGTPLARELGNRSQLAIAASTTNAHPAAPNNKLTIQNRRFLVSAEIAAMAMAIWNMVTPRANTSCL